MENVKPEQHSLKKRWGYDEEDRNVGSTKSVYAIAVYQKSDGDRWTLYLTDTDLIAKETGTDDTWSYKTKTYIGGNIVDITDAVVTGGDIHVVGTALAGSITARSTITMDWHDDLDTTAGLAGRIDATSSVMGAFSVFDFEDAVGAGKISEGDFFILDDDHTADQEEAEHWTAISSIDSGTQITLASNYGGTTGAFDPGEGYKIRHPYSLPTNGRWAWATVDDKFCFTNGNINVQYWNGVGYAKDLNAEVAVKARYCIEYANRLFIADFGAIRDPYMVGWSKEGDPTNWTDNTAGQLALLETEDYITGLGTSGGDLIIYKRDNIHIYSQSGDAFSPIYTTPTNRIRGIGCVAPYSIVEVLGTNAFLGRDDFYVINGGQVDGIGRDSARYNFFEQVSDTELENVWGFVNTIANEIIWVANTTSGQKGYAWNYITKEWSCYDYYHEIRGAGRGAV